MGKSRSFGVADGGHLDIPENGGLRVDGPVDLAVEIVALAVGRDDLARKFDGEGQRREGGIAKVRLRAAFVGSAPAAVFAVIPSAMLSRIFRTQARRSAESLSPN